MSIKKIKVAIVCGGRSTEHNISLISAQNVIKALDKEKYEPLLIGIDKKGQWHYFENQIPLLNPKNPDQIGLSAQGESVVLSQNNKERSIISKSTNQIIAHIDVIFPVLHGLNGEDGSIQGFAALANIPCVGCGILGSALCMDKDMMKRVLRDANINVAPWMTVRYRYDQKDLDNIISTLGAELFIKPANLGSSVGVSFADNKTALKEALDYALQFDHKVLIESKVIGREIECAVLGNADPQASVPGEIIAQNSFYSYENKYIDAEGAKLRIPADLSTDQMTRIQTLAVEAFTVLDCSGMARVDMFLTPQDTLVINELNTIPGFTSISMYPKLWEYSGLSQTALISKLIELAIEKHDKQSQLLLEA